MANLQINASLNITNTLANIVNDVDKKINPQIQANSKARVKLVGALEIRKTINTINANLQNINKDLKVQIGNVSFAPINTAQLQNSINQATQNVKPTVEVKPVVNTEGFKFSNKELREAIQEFNDGTNVIEAFRKQFEKFGVSISSVQNLSTTNGELQGFIATVKSASGEVEKFKYELNADDNKFHLTNVTAADTAVQKLIERTIQWQNKTSAASKDAIASLDGVKTAWENANGGKYVQSNSYRTALTEQYNEAIKKAQELANADNTTFGGLKTEVDTAIKSLSRLVAEYHDAEKVATTLRAKDYTTVLNNTDSNIKGFEADVNRVKPLVGLLSENVQKLKDNIKTLRESTAEQHVKTSTLKGLLNDLDNAERRFQSFKKLFQGFGKTDWYSSNKGLIDSLPDDDKVKVYQEYIKSLRESIKSFRDEWKQFGDTTGLKSISAEFGKLSSQLRDNLKPDTLEGWVKRFNELVDKADQVKQHLDKQVIVQKEIYRVQTDIAKLNQNPQDNAGMLARRQAELDDLQAQETKLKTKANLYAKLVPLEQQQAYVAQQTKAEREKLLDVETRLADIQNKTAVQQQAKQQEQQTKANIEVTQLYINKLNEQFNIIKANSKLMLTDQAIANHAVYQQRIDDAEKIIADTLKEAETNNLLSQSITDVVNKSRQEIAENNQLITNVQERKQREKEISEALKEQASLIAATDKANSQIRTDKLEQIKKEYRDLNQLTREYYQNSTGENLAKLDLQLIDSANKRIQLLSDELQVSGLMTDEIRNQIAVEVEALAITRQRVQAKAADNAEKERANNELKQEANYLKELDGLYSTILSSNKKISAEKNEANKQSIRDNEIKNAEKRIAEIQQEVQGNEKLKQVINEKIIAEEAELAVQKKRIANREADKTEEQRLKREAEDYKALTQMAKGYVTEIQKQLNVVDQFTQKSIKDSNVNNQFVYQQEIKNAELIIQKRMSELESNGLLSDSILKLIESRRHEIEVGSQLNQNNVNAQRQKETAQVYEQQAKAIASYTKSIDTAITKLKGLGNQPVFGANVNNTQIQTTKTNIQTLVQEYEKLKQSLNGNLTADQLTQVKTKLVELDTQLKKAETDVKQFKASFKGDKDAQKLAGDISILTAQIKKFRAQNTRSEGRFGAEYQELLNKLVQRPDTAGLYAIRQEFRKLQGDVRAAGLTGMTFFDTFKANLSKMSSWLGVSSLGMLVGREIRQMFSDVVKLDEALVDLKKTFQGTSQDLQEFYHESNNIAKQLGVTTEEVISQASSWSRLGLLC